MLFSPVCIFGVFFLRGQLKLHGLISGLSSLFHWSMCLFSGLYHIDFYYMDMKYNLRLGMVILWALFFLLRFDLIIQGLLFIQLPFGLFEEHVEWNWIVNCLVLDYSFHHMLWAWAVFLPFNVFPHFFVES